VTDVDLLRSFGRVTSALADCGEWLARAKFDDYLIAAGVGVSLLPVVGRYLEPVGGITALGVWGGRYLPDIASSAREQMAASSKESRRREREMSGQIAREGLRDITFPDRPAIGSPPEDPGPPWRHAGIHRRLVHRTSVAYGEEPGQLLDVWRRQDLTGPAPVLVFVPGGAWVIGSRVLQGHALMAHLAEQGWVCLSVQYRTSPTYRWPRQMNDITTAVAWARANVDQFGGDPSFVALAGCSAGGHMATLAGLTADDHGWNGAPSAPVDAVVSIYGRYDWEDRSTPERARFMDFLERVVVQRRQSRHPEVFRQASPMACLRADAPPFLVIHGTHDAIIPVGEARRFVTGLRAVSNDTVSYIELPGAGHGFDLTDGIRTHAVVDAISAFLNHTHSACSVAVAGTG
jgi:acetyl esterase/lipase